jgi:hypothetical protein
MSDADAVGLRALTFGAIDGSVWGAAVEHGARAVVVGSPSTGVGVAAQVSWEEIGDGGWHVSGDGFSVEVTPLPAPVPAPDAPPRPGTPWVRGQGPELCRVRGELAGVGGDFDGVGARYVAEPATSEKAAAGTVRLIGAWFPDAAAVALIAARPRRVAHQDGDRLAASLFDPEGWTTVSDPRLSTTYDGTGAPTRMNLELWISEGENEFPRRAAGEASGPGASAAADGVSLQVLPLRCHSRGEDGTGVYALATL